MDNQTELILNFSGDKVYQDYREYFVSDDGTVDNRDYYDELCQQYKETPEHRFSVGEASPLACTLYSKKDGR